MATIKSYTDLQQSKKLAEILPLESADMCYMYLGTEDKEYEDIPICAPAMEGDLCAWSLAALLGVLPDELEDNHFLTLQKEKDKYCCCYEDINGNSFTHTFADNPVDACCEMIIKLHEQTLL